VYGSGLYWFVLDLIVVSSCIVLYCIVLYCIVLCCIVLYCIVLYPIVSYCILLYFIVCIGLNCIGECCIELYGAIRNDHTRGQPATWPNAGLKFAAHLPTLPPHAAAVLDHFEASSPDTEPTTHLGHRWRRPMSIAMASIQCIMNLPRTSPPQPPPPPALPVHSHPHP
jgi:hypothetical protein